MAFFERPLAQSRLCPGYQNSAGVPGQRTATTPSAALKDGLKRMQLPYEEEEVEFIATGWNMEHGGKVPIPVIQRCDAWLRRNARAEPRALVALSEPTPTELGKIGMSRT